MNLNLKGKYGLVTGAGHGIGRAIALVLAQEGCNVAICSIDKQQVDDVVNEVKAKGVDSIGIQADATVLEDIERAIKTIIGAWGAIHILINNVGGGGRWGSPVIEETAETVWTDVYNKNALAAVRFTMRAIPFMRKQKWGRVVTVASRLGREGGGRPWFNMAKSAEISLMKTLAMNFDLARDGITFNSVAPGSIMIPDTGWEKEQKENPGEFQRKMDIEFPLGRLGKPEEIADVVAFLCSGNASLVNGACVAIDGGESRYF
ncbi:MAG: hypothetical protein A2626_00715 [Candidatus Nealsonbacteria bacterium RIFCSPHIGHO2_01_FULL_38_55]|uniref:Short-chain dehydrogenase n=2 Tax=Candidatus Nealsoniibacteriota TaxID=1817911 RepID=A0A1G2EI43_9BACT|nr:MAG: 3-oxoacyl-acyl carrier protein reductase [Parcubacteria group bacterium GW2011_GWA2_38_27]OGZ19944.1 MAG: hypothetical protein A2626_00715 [Candidatus Nealsonbacteria bacterium RIFCSPHIGHO2_01_FULL_38_55]OGZ22006.1 MAG: hypothetical protein A3C48_03285 [Candidatus Nealsonbacteria bacterium RIFCSPHIGHO2_02_FULL_38_75]OGZ25449.1 MAG: hypothetical protein A2W71_02995 [Candidatus Nealsonbacteria bacterium RIFCSPLOWO2_02_39_8]